VLGVPPSGSLADYLDAGGDVDRLVGRCGGGPEGVEGQTRGKGDEQQRSEDLDSVARGAGVGQISLKTPSATARVGVEMTVCETMSFMAAPFGGSLDAAELL
jgi:hypothetical protein